MDKKYFQILLSQYISILKPIDFLSFRFFILLERESRHQLANDFKIKSILTTLNELLGP